MPELDWTNLTAVGTCLALLVFIVTRALPQMFNKYTEELRVEREAFQVVLSQQRTDFRDTLSKHHEMTIEMANRGNETINGLRAAVDRLADSQSGKGQ